MRNLNFDLKELCQRNRDGSQSAQADRYAILQQMANALHELGFQHMRATSLKPKHVDALVASYLDAELSIGTVKNRLSALRWWASKIQKANVVARDNAFYGVGSREFVTNQSKATELDQQKLAIVDCPNLRMSLMLQKAFGLRREEAIKFIPAYADQGDHIRLKASWCKGGKARTIPIRTDGQRELIQQARELVGLGSLIPPQLSYIQQLRRYEDATYRAGLSKMHGLRHRYAQERYLELTGWAAPACGGPIRRDLNDAQRAADRVARVAISQELGHEREQITSVYCGR